jgi:hypothetical protein
MVFSPCRPAMTTEADAVLSLKGGSSGRSGSWPDEAGWTHRGCDQERIEILRLVLKAEVPTRLQARTMSEI